MSPDLRDMFDWIDGQHQRMHRLVVELAQMNSGSFNLAGLAQLANRLEEEFGVLKAPIERINLVPRQEIDALGQPVATALGQALRIRKVNDRANAGGPAAARVFLCIHYDTVYGHDHPFQTCDLLDGHTLQGPGVADAKGGIVVMLIALEAVNQSAWRDRIDWEVLLNPDEEIGSPGSATLLREAAARHDIGMVFEPTLESGHFAAPRKGSGNFTLVVRGKAAHAGRAFEQGRNAMHLIAGAVVELAGLNDMKQKLPGVSLNVAKIEGGGPANIVPDLAIARFNARVTSDHEQRYIEQFLTDLVASLNTIEGFQSSLHGLFNSPPKPIDEATLTMLHQLRECGQSLNLDIAWQPTGGVCDGNKLAAFGLPTLDTFGPRGSGIHSDRENIKLESLTERAKLAAMFMTRRC